MLPRLLITAGEPAGIGPDVVLAVAGMALDARLACVADPGLLAQRAERLGAAIDVVPVEDGSIPRHEPGHLAVWPVKTRARAEAGRLDPANAPYVLETLALAADACLAGDADAMVTAPVHKAVINDAGIAFSGHTEFLAARCGGVKPVMLLAGGGLRVALATTHLPLAHVPGAIGTAMLGEILDILDRDLRRRFAVDAPRILVCGLNPHAGEGGHLGDEEARVIRPAVEAARDRGIDARGPVPADTAFTHRSRVQADVILAMYHDQGLPVLKALGFGEAVNVTLGLPIVRTSVDHGTALDLAGTGRAEADSLDAAVRLAAELAGNRR